MKKKKTTITVSQFLFVQREKNFFCTVLTSEKQKKILQIRQVLESQLKIVKQTKLGNFNVILSNSAQKPILN